MYRRIAFQPLLIACLACLCAIATAPTRWHSDIGTKGAQRYTTTLRESESAAIDSTDTTFQWAFPGSSILRALPTQTHIVSLQTMQRSEQPARTVTFTIAQHSYTIAGIAGIRTIQLLAPPSPTITIHCDTTATSDPALAALCIALLRVDSQRISPAVDILALGWLFVLATSIALGALLTLPQSPRLAAVLSASLLAIALSFPHAVSVSYPGLICLTLLWVVAVLLIRWRSNIPWVQIALLAMIAHLLLKTTGVLSPGYLGTDIGFHAHKFEAVLRGTIFQIADGQGLTYPYPPTIYTLIAPIVLPLQAIVPLTLLIHLSAVVIDSSTIILLAWLAHRFGWSHLRIGLMSALYVVLPAGFLLQWQATVAQTIGQWLGVIAVVTSFTDQRTLSRLSMALTMVGHFGAFLTLHLTYTLAFLHRSLRPIALRWWGVFVVVSVCFFSQYVTTILAQFAALTQSDGNTTIAERWWQYAWQYGIYGHYYGIGLALMLIGLWSARSDRLRALSGLMVGSTTILMLAQVLADIDTTRYVIALFPFVALYAAVPLAQLWRSNAGRTVVVSLLGLILIQSGQAWFAGVTQGVRMGFLW